MASEEGAQSEASVDDDVMKAAKNLKFELLRQAFYHSDELWFYSFVERMTKFLSVIAGTAVVGTVLVNYPRTAVALGFFITVLQMAGLVFGVSTRALLHESKRQRYFSLLADFETEPVTGASIKRVQSQMMRVWGEEPPTMWGVEVVAWNSAMTAMTPKLKEGDLIPIYWWEKCIRYVWRFDPEYFRRREYRSS